MNRKRYVGVGALAVLGAAVLWLAFSRGPLAPVAVVVAQVKEAELTPTVFGIGTVEARHAYAVGPTQAGRVLNVHVDHGDAVKAGQVLAEIDPVDLRERLRSADSALQRVRSGVLVAQAQVSEARSRYAMAAANAARYSDLVQKNFVSREAAEIRSNEAKVASAGAEAAQAALLAARQDVERAVRDRQAIERQLANLTLTSPVDGVVIAREAEPGTTIVAGQAIVRVIDPGSLWVRVRVDQGQAGDLVAGLAAEVVLRSNPARPVAGRVARVEIQSDAVTEERIVAVAFDAPPPLTVGELAEVTIRRGNVTRGLVIPTAAIKRRDQERGVWQIVDGRTRFRAVETGLQTLDGMTELLGGLDSGEAVVVYSNARLREGVKVRVGKTS